MKYLGLMILSLALTSCSALSSGSGTGSSGTTTTTFTEPTLLQITPEEGQANAVKMITGRFSNDIYPDLLLLTEGGAILYEISSLDNSLTVTRREITGLDGKNISDAVAENFDGDDDGLDDLIVYEDDANLRLYLNGGSGVFTLQATLSPGATVNDLGYIPSTTVASTGFLIGARDTLGNHFTATIRNSVLAALTNRAELTGSAIRALVAKFLGNATSDLLLVPSNASLDMQAYTNSSDTSLSFTKTFDRPTTNSVQWIEAINLTGDTKPDLLLATSGGFELYTNAGSFNFTTVEEENFDLDIVASKFLIADFTDDGNYDLFMSRAGDSSLFYTGLGSLNFSDITSTAFGTDSLDDGAIDLLSIDIDQDSALDIVQLFDDGRISVHINSLEID